ALPIWALTGGPDTHTRSNGGTPMRLTRRHRDDADDRDQVRGRDAYPDADPGWRDPPGEPAEGHELVETETHKPARWGLPAMLTAAAGVALAVLGVVALV